MKAIPEKVFRVLAFQAEGKELVKGEEARGTLAIMRTGGDEPALSARFTRDAGGGSDFVDFPLSSYDIFPTPGPRQRKSVVLVLENGKRHTFITYKEIPVDGVAIKVSIVKAAVNPGVRT